jgi:hypothetical protein
VRTRRQISTTGQVEPVPALKATAPATLKHVGAAMNRSQLEPTFAELVLEQAIWGRR